MYWVVILVMTSQITRTSGQLDSPHLPWRTTLDRRDDSEDSQTSLCNLPPYPERGGYVVVDAPGAGPGDAYRNVSLVQYVEDNYGYLQLKLLRCSSGRWREYIFKYNSEKLYFNASWCPLLCPPGGEAPTQPATATEAHETFEETRPDLCKLPPKKGRVGYNTRDAVFGKTFDELDVYQYVLDEEKGVYEIVNLECKNGRWVEKFWKQRESESWRFEISKWCPFLCTSKIVQTDPEPAKEPYLSNVKVTEESSKNRTKCELPPYPKDGNYTVTRRAKAAPGDVLGAAHLSYSCHSNTKLVGSKDVYCIEGAWSDDAPKCIRCGSIRSYAVERINAEDAARRELPWHVAIYDKQRAYEHICSGSIVATNLVVTAAHCFGNGAEDSQPASRFVVAAGKTRGGWDGTADEHAQTSDVTEVIIHPRYRGDETSYQNDIALMFLDTPLHYTDYVMSVCVDFDVDLDEKQLADGSRGKIASWNSASKNGSDIPKLKVDWAPYVDTNKCISESPASLLQYITSDKICAGDAKGTTLCKSDGGSSFSYHLWNDDSSRVNYLRGVASISPRDEQSCNVNPVTVFTHVLRHKSFLEEYLKEAIW